MRTLSATLLAAQKNHSQGIPQDFIAKIVLTKSGEDTLTYTGTRLMDVNPIEQPDNQTSEVWLDNSDGVLTTLSVEGYKGVISKGFTTGAGDEYSAAAPLWVIGQQLFSDAITEQLSCRLSLAGILNLMGEDEANADYAPASDDTDTVKDLLQKIFGDSPASLLDCYDHCTAYDLVFDSEDSLIDVFQPKDGFSISRGDNRRDKANELLSYTGCVMKAEDDGKVHIFVPTTTGTSYDYEYSYTSGEHSFFNKTLRNRIVIPSKVQVDSHPSHSTTYTGSAQVDDYATLPSEVKKTEYLYLRLASDAQAAAIATARLARHKWDAETGHGFAPINVGAEVHDYVKITDSRQGDSKVGNIGYLNRHYTPGKADMEFRFGSIFPGGLAGTMPPGIGGGGGGGIDLSDIWDFLNMIWNQVQANTAWIENYRCPYEGYIHIIPPGDIWFTPQSGGLTCTFANMGISETTPKFGLLKDTANGALYFFDSAGTYSHTFCPETTEKGKLGLSTKKWAESHLDKMVAYTRATAPVGTDLFDS